MELAGRKLGRLLGAPFKAKHYSALFRSFGVYDHPVRRNCNYLFSTGKYPSDIQLKSNGQKVSARLRSSHDLLTVNEVFCRVDYPCRGNEKIIVDIGSNIGISALYFLSHAPQSSLYLYEPNPANIGLLKKNLGSYSDRISITESAVADREGELDFGVEDSGRYGGLGLDLGKSIKVKCLHINEVLRQILAEHDRIDILKMDTEGAEIPSINSIDESFLQRIDRIYFEEGIPERLTLLDSRVFESFDLTSRDNGHYLSFKGPVP